MQIVQRIDSSDLIVDHELTARQANVRRWWRRAIVMAVFVVVVAPVTSVVVLSVRQWQLKQSKQIILVDPPAPHDEPLARAYITYMRTEGHAHRGANFNQLSAQINMRIVPGFGMVRTVTEAKLLYYLGPPDEDFPEQHVYFFNQPPKMCVICTIARVNGQNVLSTMSYTSITAYRASVTSSSPSTTKSSNSQDFHLTWEKK